MKNLDLQQGQGHKHCGQTISNQNKLKMVLSCFNIKFDDKGRFDLLSFATLILKAEIYSVYSPVYVVIYLMSYRRIMYSAIHNLTKGLNIATSSQQCVINLNPLDPNPTAAAHAVFPQSSRFSIFFHN